MAEMRAGRGIGEHAGKELALPALGALLVALRAAGFGCQFLSRRKEVGKLIGAARAELVDPHETGAALGQSVVGIEGLGGCYHGVEL